jgi:hypothetical protein
MYYGCGVFGGKYGDHGKKERWILYHMGGTYGATAFFALSLEEDVAVAIVCNLGGTDKTLLTEYMVHSFLDKCFKFSKIDWVQEEIDRHNKCSEMIREYHDSFTNNYMQMPMNKMDTYVGTYESKMYGEVRVFEKGGELYLTNGINTTKLTFLNGMGMHSSVFEFPDKNMSFSFMDGPAYAIFEMSEALRGASQVYISCFDENNEVFKRRATTS